MVSISRYSILSIQTSHRSYCMGYSVQILVGSNNTNLWSFWITLGISYYLHLIVHCLGWCNVMSTVWWIEVIANKNGQWENECQDNLTETHVWELCYVLLNLMKLYFVPSLHIIQIDDGKYRDVWPTDLPKACHFFPKKSPQITWNLRGLKYCTWNFDHETWIPWKRAPRER